MLEQTLQPAMVVWLTLSVSLMSGLVGALVSIVVYGRREKRRFKLATLQRVAANRYDLKGEEFTRALNEVFIVYNDSEPVMKALSDFHTAVLSKQKANDRLVALFKAMCSDAGVSSKQFTDSFFTTPFNTKPSSQLPAP